MARPRLVSFDCYGTLIDWAAGVRASAAPYLQPSGADVDALFAAWWHVDRQQTIDHPYRPYRQVLAVDFRQALGLLGVDVGEDEARQLAGSLVDWQPFPDSAAALQRLRQAGCELAILSNIDDDLLDATVERLGVRFDHRVTAQAVRSYKPAPAHFEEILRRTGYRPDDILHAAASLRVDVVPAKRLGLRTAHVQREEPDADTEITPDHVVRGMAGLAELVESL